MRSRTVPVERYVLGIVRTVTSAVRLLDALDAFRGDVRVQVKFAVLPGSAFEVGARRVLEEAGTAITDLDAALGGQPDLIVTASENGVPSGARPPGGVIVIPHGVGFHKLLADRPGATRLSGIVAQDVTALTDVTTVVSHASQAEILASGASASGGRVALVRDDFYGRLVASRRWRSRYRDSLGVGPAQRLITVTSTWGAESLLGRWPQLPEMLVGELPYDSYAVALVVHPNAWSWHGSWQLRSWMADATAAGLLLVPPTTGWQSALVAADAVLGDHGSVTFYAAALGLPVAAAPALSEVVPGSPMHDLLRDAPTLAGRSLLRPQIEALLSRGAGPEGRRASESAFHMGAAPTLAELLYSRLRLPARRVGTRTWAAWTPVSAPVSAFVVRSWDALDGVVRLERFGATAPPPPPPAGRGGVDGLRHLSCYDDDADDGRWRSASVVIRRGSSGQEEALAWVQANGADHLVAAAPRRGGLLVSFGRSLLLDVEVEPPDVDPVIAIAALYHRLISEVADGATRTQAVSATLGRPTVASAGNLSFAVTAREHAFLPPR